MLDCNEEQIIERKMNFFMHRKAVYYQPSDPYNLKELDIKIQGYFNQESQLV